MTQTLWRLTASCALLAILGGCANPGNDGRESSITAYGTVDAGVSRTIDK